MDTEKKEKAIHSYRVFGVNKQGLQDNKKVHAYSKGQAKWKALNLYGFRIVKDALQLP